MRGPGRITRIHDHITWYAFAVLQGIEYEELLDTHLNMIGFCRVSADLTHTSYRPCEGNGPYVDVPGIGTG
jgi:hypothetical protein